MLKTDSRCMILQDVISPFNGEHDYFVPAGSTGHVKQYDAITNKYLVYMDQKYGLFQAFYIHVSNTKEI